MLNGRGTMKQTFSVIIAICIYQINQVLNENTIFTQEIATCIKRVFCICDAVQPWCKTKVFDYMIVILQFFKIHCV